MHVLLLVDQRKVTNKESILHGFSNLISIIKGIRTCV